MNEIIMARADVRVMLFHMALYGLGAILDEAGIADVRLSWTSGMEPRPRIGAPGLTSEVVDDAVRSHAASHVNELSWVQRDVELNGRARGLMSPRLSSFGERSVWESVQQARHRELDRLTDRRAWLDLQMLAALGEPCYWSRNRQDDVLQDDGASRLEMQPRNQGSEFVGSRLRKLAASVAARRPGAVSAGIEGTVVVDEIGSDKVDSRTPTGFANPGPADNAIAWCALWGIAALPTAPRIGASAVTSGHLGRPRGEWFYTPVWEQPWQPARLRSMFASRMLRDAAAVDLRGSVAVDPARDVTARSWLVARGVSGIVRFAVDRFGSDSAPERRAMRGMALPTAR